MSTVPRWRKSALRHANSFMLSSPPPNECDGLRRRERILRVSQKLPELELNFEESKGVVKGREGPGSGGTLKL